MATVLTWELLDARPNGAGDAVILTIKVTGTNTELDTSPNVERSIGWVEMLLHTMGYSMVFMELANIDVTMGNPAPTTESGFVWSTI